MIKVEQIIINYFYYRSQIQQQPIIKTDMKICMKSWVQSLIMLLTTRALHYIFHQLILHQIHCHRFQIQVVEVVAVVFMEQAPDHNHRYCQSCKAKWLYYQIVWWEKLVSVKYLLNVGTLTNFWILIYFRPSSIFRSCCEEAHWREPSTPRWKPASSTTIEKIYWMVLPNNWSTILNEATEINSGLYRK